jgi:mRNA-degrading endonuclease toxin of MazEF toxin-antitoxin module
VKEKDYARWMPVKAGIHNSRLRPKGFDVGDIWICNIGENIGHEEDGKGAGFARPVLIVAKHGYLTSHVVPLSTTDKRGRFYYPFDGHTGKTSVALLSQSRAIDSSRLRKKIGKATPDDLRTIKDRLRDVLAL